MRFCISSWPDHVAFCVSLFALVACGQQAEGTATAGSSQHGATSSGSGAGGTGGGTPRPLVVFDWNMHNFYNDNNDSNTPAPTDEIILTTAQYQQKRQAIAAVIKPLDPDIIVVAEVEHQSILDDLNADLGNAYAERVLIEGNDPRGVDVGAM